MTSAWELLLTRPRGVSPRTSAHVLGTVFAIIAGLTVLAALVDGTAAEPAHLAAGGISIVLAVLVLRCWRRLRPTAFWIFHAVEGVVLAVQVRAADDPLSALSWSLLFTLLLAESFYVLSWLEASVEFLVGAGLLGWALAPVSALGAGHRVLALGVLIAACVATGRLVRATAEAEYDALTGVVNRRGMQRRVDEAVVRAAQRPDADLVLCLVDLDHFKMVNDTRGHAAGDEVLCRIAAAAQAALPRRAVFARWGGDEFALLTVGLPVDRVRSHLDVLRSQLPPGQTVSIGMARWQPGQTVSDLLSDADAALYAVKREARGGVRLFGGELAPRA